MKQIIFSTGNDRKMRDAVAACEPFGIEVIKHPLEIDEIQSHEPLKIAEHKAEQAFEVLRQPVVINDAFWKIPALNGFPGGYMKDINEWFQPQDLLNLMKDKEDRSVCVVECVIYKDSHVTKTFTKEYWHEFAHEPKGTGNAIEQTAMYNGKTIGQSRELNEHVIAPKDFVWHEFATWFATYDKSNERDSADLSARPI